MADDELLVTSANLSDSAQLDNCELGIHFPAGQTLPGNSHADSVWQHLDRPIHRLPPALVLIEQPLAPPSPSDHAPQRAPRDRRSDP